MTIKQLGGVFGRNPTFNDVTIEGTLTFDGDIDITSDLTIGGNLTVSKTYGAVIKLESAGTGLGSGTVIGDIQFFGNDLSVPGAGIKAGIKVETVAALGDDAQMKFTTSDGATNNIDRMLIANNGDISFYENTGTTAKFFWDASAESLGIGIASPLGQLHINTETAGATTVYVDGESNQTKSIEIRHYDASEGSGAGRNLFYLKTPASNRLDIGNFTDGSVESQLMTFLESGNVGIGTTSPAVAFHVNSGATNEAARFESTDTEVTLELKDTTGTAKIKSRADFRFETGATPSEAMRLDSSGNLLVGTTTAPHASAKVRISGGGLQVGGQVSLRQNDIYNSGSGRTFTITGGANGSQSFIEFTAYNRYGYVRKNYYIYNGGGTWTIVENESATNGTAPTVTATDGATATIVVTGAGASPSTFGGGIMTTVFDSSYVTFA